VADGQTVVIGLVSGVLPSIIRVRVTDGVAEVRVTSDYAEIVARGSIRRHVRPAWIRRRPLGRSQR